MDRTDREKPLKRTLLEQLEPGTDEDLKVQKISPGLPEGVSSRDVYRDILRIALPASVELMLSSLVSMVDLMMVGGLGTWAITSVGLTTQPKFLLMTMVMSMNVGATALVAQSKGAGNQAAARKYARQAVTVNLLMGAALSLLGLLTADPLVRFMGAKTPRILDAGTAYLQIQMASFLFFSLTSTLTAVLRGIGDSRTAMYYNSAANLSNIVLNYLLIHGHYGFPRLEVAGASLATAISQVLACGLAIGAVSRQKCYLHMSLRDDFRPCRREIGEIARIGLPAALEQFMMRIGSLIFSKTVASLGTVEFAAHQVCMNIQSLTMMNGQVFSISATSLMGQSLGRRRPDMAQAYTTRCRRCGMSVAVLMGLAFVLFGRPLSGLYTEDAACILICVEILWIVAFIQPFQSSQFIVAGALRGAGDTKFVAKLTFYTVLLLRPGLAILAVRGFHMGLPGAWLAITTDQILRSALIALRYRSGQWKQLPLLRAGKTKAS